MWKGEGKGYRQGERSKRNYRGREEWREEDRQEIARNSENQRTKDNHQLNRSNSHDYNADWGKTKQNKTKKPRWKRIHTG